MRNSIKAVPVGPRTTNPLQFSIGGDEVLSPENQKFIDNLSPKEKREFVALGRTLLRCAIQQNPEEFDEIMAALAAKKNKMPSAPVDVRISPVCLPEAIPDYRPRPQIDLRNYWTQLEPGYRRTIRSLAAQIPGIEKSCKLSICIPIAAHEEEHFVRRTLECFLNQSADRHKYEIVILANHPDVSSAGGKIKPDKTISEIVKFQQQHPEMPIRLAYGAFEREHLSIGHIRAVLSDLVICRHLRRGPKAGDHLFLRTDGDLGAVHPMLVDYYLRIFRDNPGVDSFKGWLGYTPAELAQNPIIFASARLEETLERYMRILHPERVGGGGANFAFKASSYALSQGYNPETKLGEDVELGASFHEMRKGSKRFCGVTQARSPSLICVSTRRAEAAFQHEYAPAEQWSHSEFEFGTQNPAIRKNNPTAWRSADQIEQLLETRRLKRLLSKLLSNSIATYYRWSDKELTSRSPAVRHVLQGVLGLKYRTAGKTAIKVTDVTEFKKHFKLFRETADVYFDRKENLVRFEKAGK